MNHKQRHTLHAVFAHPVSSNLDPRLAHSMLEALGGEVTHGGHGQIVVKLNGHSHGFHESRHALSKEEVMALRKFLEVAGIGPVRDFPLGTDGAEGPRPSPIGSHPAGQRLRPSLFDAPGILAT
jgi:hypothetical protein